MKARDKAKQLVDTYLDIEHYNNLNLDLFCDECGMSDKAAKLCALIAVNEIIHSNPHSNPFNTNVESTMSYWKEVKKEISKL